MPSRHLSSLGLYLLAAEVSEEVGNWSRSFASYMGSAKVSCSIRLST
jgi:hypothetical protein